MRAFVRIVRELDATYFVFENVKYSSLGRHRRFLQELMDAFDANGYAVLPELRVRIAYN